MLKEATFEEALKALNEGHLINVVYEGKTATYQLGNKESKGYDAEVVVDEFNNVVHSTMYDLNWRFVLSGQWFIDTEAEIIVSNTNLLK